jgi:isopropylmalate/homocitrate/citramalate synthase
MGTTVIKDIKIVEVSPRDGLQNEKEIIPFDKKKSFIEKLMEKQGKEWLQLFYTTHEQKEKFID